MSFLDFLILPVLLLIIFIIAKAIRNTRYKNDPSGKYFTLGLLVKIIGAAAFALIYLYYYGGGDTFAYYDGGIAWNNYYDNEPGNAIDFLFTSDNTEYIDHVVRLKYYAPRIDNVHILKPSAELTMIKITGIILFLFPDSFVLSTIIFGFFTFFGIWCLYRTFVDVYPEASKQLAIAVLFMPSVVFWGSGMMKDTVTLSALGFLTYGCYNIFFKQSKILFSILLIIASGYIIAQLKGYILLAFIPAFLLFMLQFYKKKIHSQFLRIIATPVLLIVMALAGLLLVSQLDSLLGRYSIENLEGVAKDYQSWHQVASADGSSYQIGDGTDFSLGGIVTNFPAAVNVALFRPYLWEANSLVMLLSSFESLFILGFFLLTFFRTGPIKFFRIIFNHPFLLFCFIFSMIFAFAVGYTSFNFGALVRYKIPLIPFFMALLFLIRWNYSKEKEEKEADKAQKELEEAEASNARTSLKNLT